MSLSAKVLQLLHAVARAVTFFRILTTRPLANITTKCLYPYYPGVYLIDPDRLKPGFSVISR